MGFFRDERVEDLLSMVRNLTDRVQMLEKDARYYADQPQYTGFFAANAYSGIDYNLVPLNQVVKAIVKHLDMQIEKVPKQTINKPVEVKVVPKPQMMVGETGVVTMTDGSGIPMPASTLGTWTTTVAPEKPKRKQTVKKQVVKPAVKKTTRKAK